MRLADYDRIARLGLPETCERLVEIIVQFAGRIVGDIYKRHYGRRGGPRRQHAHCHQQTEPQCSESILAIGVFSNL